jgi:hypothetical protein
VSERKVTERARPKRTFIDLVQPNRWIWRQEVGPPRDPFGTIEAVRHVPAPPERRPDGLGDPEDPKRLRALAAWRRRTSRRPTA